MEIIATVTLLVTTGIYLILLGIALFLKRSQLTLFFALLMLLAAIWSATAAAEINAHTLLGKVRSLQFRLMFVIFIPYAWTGLVLSLTGMLRAYRKPLCWLALAAGAMTSMLVLTMQHNEWFRYNFSITMHHGLELLAFDRSRLDMLHEMVNHAVSLVGFFLLISAWHSSNRLLRKQIVLLSISFVVPLVGNMLFVFRLVPWLGFNPTPLLLLPSSCMQAWVVFRYRVLNVLPLARNIILDHVDVGVIVLDREGRIIDINPSAQTITGAVDQAVLGQYPAVLDAPWASAIGNPGRESEVVEGTGDRWIGVERVPIIADHAAEIGTLIMLKDATADVLRIREQKLMQKSEDQARQVHFQRMLLRDIHDGMGGMAANLSFMSLFACQEQDAAMRDQWLRKIEHTAAQINIEIQDLMNSLESTSMTWGDVVSSIRRSASLLFMDNAVEVEFQVSDHAPDDQIGLAEGLSISRMGREAMNNIVKHAGATRVTVAFCLSATECTLEIHDNGCGFDPQRAPRNRGMNNMERRSTELGGTCTVSSESGTRVVFTIPRPVKIRCSAAVEEVLA